MKNFAEKLTYIGFPKVLFEMTRAYFRIEVGGLEHLPRRGKALVVPNHSGCTGVDAFVLANLIRQEVNRVPRVLALWSIMRGIPFLETAARKTGLKEASSRNGLELLRKNSLTVIFPEGEGGSFKPSSDRYKLQYFHTGFVRMAILSGAPVIPCIVIGAEESNINLAKIQFKRLLKGTVIPLPFNILPFPAKWKIQFLPPVDLSSFSKDDTNDKGTMQAAADNVKNLMQRVIDKELIERTYIYFGDRTPLLSQNG
jgi:1-acyl-sn-glycerol-3-phosphate acyltransferase